MSAASNSNCPNTRQLWCRRDEWGVPQLGALGFNKGHCSAPSGIRNRRRKPPADAVCIHVGVALSQTAAESVASAGPPAGGVDSSFPPRSRGRSGKCPPKCRPCAIDILPITNTFDCRWSTQRPERSRVGIVTEKNSGFWCKRWRGEDILGSGVTLPMRICSWVQTLAPTSRTCDCLHLGDRSLNAQTLNRHPRY